MRRPADWKTATPKLQLFVLDMRKSGISHGLSDNDIESFIKMG